MTLALRLGHLRGLAGLSARSLSVLAGISPTHVSLIEAGRVSSPESHTSAALASVLGCSLDWLIAGKGKPPTEESVRAAVKRAKRSRAA